MLKAHVYIGNCECVTELPFQLIAAKVMLSLGGAGLRVNCNSKLNRIHCCKCIRHIWCHTEYLFDSEFAYAVLRTLTFKGMDYRVSTLHRWPGYMKLYIYKWLTPVWLGKAPFENPRSKTRNNAKDGWQTMDFGILMAHKRPNTRTS